MNRKLHRQEIVQRINLKTVIIFEFYTLTERKAVGERKKNIKDMSKEFKEEKVWDRKR